MNQTIPSQVPGKSATFARNTALALLFAMMVGLIWSRALLSIAQGALLFFAIAYFIYSRKPIRASGLLGWSLVPLALFLLGTYQQPLAKGNFDYLLTIAVYPVAALSTMLLLQLLDKRSIMAIWIIVGVASLTLPVIDYFNNLSTTYIMYAQAKTLRVWMDADHVRYGLFLDAVLLLLLFDDYLKKSLRYVLLAALMLSILLLAVRTAWVGAAIIVFAWSWSKLKATRFSNMRWLLPIGAAIICIASYHLVPSVKGKVDYMIYDLQSFSETKYNPDFSDGTRRAVNSTAYNLVTTEGAGNVGWSKISVTLKSSFEKRFGQPTEFGWPFNQWLYWWLGAGWWTMLLFSFWILYPIYHGIRSKNAPLIIWTIVITLSCLVESNLSLQYGVFLHAWVSAFLWLTSKPGNCENQKA